MTVKELATSYCDRFNECSDCPFSGYSWEICPILSIKLNKPLAKTITLGQLALTCETLAKYETEAETYLSYLLNTFPKVKLGEDGTPESFCPEWLYGTEGDAGGIDCDSVGSCKECWGRLIPFPKRR